MNTYNSPALTEDDYFDQVELGLEHLNPWLCVNIIESETPGMVYAIVTVQEGLAFHADLDKSARAGERLCVMVDTGTVPKFDELGELTDDAYHVLESVIMARYDGENFEVLDSSPAVISFDIALEVSETLDAAALGLAIYEGTKLVDFHNEADPGTFGSEYLFGSILTDAMASANNE